LHALQFFDHPAYYENFLFFEEGTMLKRPVLVFAVGCVLAMIRADYDPITGTTVDSFLCGLKLKSISLIYGSQYDKFIVGKTQVTRTSANLRSNLVRDRSQSKQVQNNSAVSASVRVTQNAGIIYVSPSGLDSNDGLSWGTAKQTIFTALKALPGGSPNPPTAGGGTVYVAQGSSANPNANAGIWIMGGYDPKYKNPPPGWLRATAPLQIVGANCSSAISNSAAGPQCSVAAGGGTDANHPAVWMSGTATTIRFKDLGFAYPGVGIRLGTTSTGDRTGVGGVQNVTFDNVSANLNQIAGNGPTVDIGSNCFNIWFTGSTFSGNGQGQAIIAGTGLSRANNVLTVTTRSPHGFSSGDNVGIFNAKDGSFDGSFRSIVVTGPDTFTVSQSGPDGVSGDGAVIDDRGEAIVVDPGTGAGSGLIFFQNAVINGGVRFWLGIDGGGMFIDHVYSEGDYSHILPPLLWIGGQPTIQVHFQVNQSALADQLNGWPAYTVINDVAGISPDMVVIIGGNGYSDSSLGPATIVGTFDPSSALSPTRKGQQGIKANHLFAQTDVARSSPQSVRFPNLVPTANTSWIPSGGLTITHNVTDRDGGTNAAQASVSPSGIQAWMTFGEQPVTNSVGDIYICGVWVRSLAPVSGTVGAGFSRTRTFPINCGLNNIKYTTSWRTDQGTPSAGDGEWEWVWRAFKIGSQSGPSVNFGFAIYADSLHPVQAYSPVAIHIPAGSVSDNEAYNIAINLRGYLNTCSPGMVCDSIGQVPHVNAPQSWTATQSFGPISINDETVSAVPRAEQNVFLPGALTSTWTASTWTPDKAVTLTRVQIQAKTPPAECFTNAVVQIASGSNVVKLAVSAAANDSGAVSQNLAAGVPLTVSVQTAASGCAKAPADANVTLQYKMR